jgi:hypothetical protein
MPKHNLDFHKLHSLLKSVFDLREDERALTFFVDLPDEKVRDNTEWEDRRRIASEWYNTLSANMRKLPFTAIMLCTYDNVHTNNNDLPIDVTLAAITPGNSAWIPGEVIPLEGVLSTTSIVLAPTQLSATAPLKNLAKQFGFRGATLPGFSRKMMPALMLDYEKVNKRTMDFKSRLDSATSARIVFRTEGKEYVVNVDLRYRSAHASGGLMREAGIVANLPSGEAYIVPYEGERPGYPSQTSGLLPVQFGAEIVVYCLKENRASEVISSGKISDEERLKLQEEPAYGNIAELGFGVLDEWGVTATGSILIDEKLGLHIAFGRSEHFGGVTGPDAFRSPANVIHIDRVYVPSMQTLVSVSEVTLAYSDGGAEIIMRSGKYIV